MKAQSGNSGVGRGGQRKLREQNMSKKTATKKRTLRNEAPGKKPGFRKVSKAVAKRLSDGRKMGR